jgi:predicted transcriptional regulator
MDFKRLNNMTGKDPVLNRRITSIFLSEFETFKRHFTLLPSSTDLDQFQFLLHKIRPSLVIFELDNLIKKYEEFLDVRKTGGAISENDPAFLDTINQTDAKLQMVKEFLNSLP